MISLILAASMWVEVKHPPTTEKVCVIGENWIESKNLSCSFDDITIKEHPMLRLMPVPPNGKKLPNTYDILYQCSYKYKCEVVK